MREKALQILRRAEASLLIASGSSSKPPQNLVLSAFRRLEMPMPLRTVGNRDIIQLNRPYPERFFVGHPHLEAEDQTNHSLLLNGKYGTISTS